MKYTEEQKEARRVKAREYQRKKKGKTVDEIRPYVSNTLAKRTLREVGEVLGMSPTMVMNVEREALQKFCDRLEASCEDLRKEFYAGLESNRSGNSGGVHRIIPRPELGNAG